MGFYYKGNGGYVGGCGAQLGGLLLVALLLSIYDYIPFRYIFLCILGIVIIMVVVLYVIGFIADYKEKKQEKKDNITNK